jgi:hypothetical protein
MESGPPLDAARAEVSAMTVSNRINEEQSVRNSDSAGNQETRTVPTARNESRFLKHSKRTKKPNQ